MHTSSDLYIISCDVYNDTYITISIHIACDICMTDNNFGEVFDKRHPICTYISQAIRSVEFCTYTCINQTDYVCTSGSPQHLNRLVCLTNSD